MSLIFNPLCDPEEYFIYPLIKSLIFTRSTFHALVVSTTFLEQSISQHEGGNKRPQYQGRGAVGSSGRRWEERSVSSDQVTAALRDLHSSRPITGPVKIKHKLTCASSWGDWEVEERLQLEIPGLGGSRGDSMFTF